MATEMTPREMLESRDEAVEALNEGLEALHNAYELLSQAKRIVRKLPTDYNMSGNMEAYVLNYINDSPDCMVDKVERYIEQLNSMEIEVSEEDEEE